MNYGLSQEVTSTSTNSEPTLAIGEVARAAGVNPSRIRYYERKGLLPPPARVSGRRRYDPGILQLLRVIEVSKDAGFSLSEVKRLLRGFDRRTAPSARWRAMAEQKLTEIEALIVDAERMRALLERGLDCGCLTLDDCLLLEAEGAYRPHYVKPARAFAIPHALRSADPREQLEPSETGG